MINEKDVAFYRENGYLLVENVFDAATLAKIRKVIADLVVKAAGVKTHNDIYDLEPTHTPENPRVRRIKTPHKVDPFFMEVVKQGDIARLGRRSENNHDQRVQRGMRANPFQHLNA